MKIKQFIANHEAIEHWLNKEGALFEKDETDMSYYYDEKGIYVHILDIYTAEFKVMLNGQVEMVIEGDDIDEVLFSGGGMATSEKVLFELFNKLKKELKKC